MARQARKRIATTSTRRAGRVFLREYIDRQGNPRITSKYYIEFYVTGDNGRPRRVREATEETNEAKARALLQIKQGEIASGKLRIDKVGVTFEDIYLLLEEHYSQNGQTLQPRPRLSAHFKEWRVSKIDDLEILAFRRKRLAAGAKAATVNRELQMLQQSFNLARAARLLAAVPLFPARLRENNARKGFFEREDFQAFAAALPLHCRPLAEVAYRTGWRLKDELLTRQWHHARLDAKNGWLRLDTGETKNGEGRTFPMTAGLLSILTTQRAYVTNIERATGKVIPWMFIRPDGQQMRGIRAAWKKAAEASGVKRIPHDLRRTAVRNLEEAGVDRLAAMKMVGHKTEEMYRRYAIIDQKVIDRAKDKLMAYESECAAADKLRLVSSR